MARLLRSTTKSFLRPPILTQAVVSFRGIMVKHASVKPRADYSQRYFARSELRPPTVVTSAVILYGPQKKLAPHPKQARQAHSKLRPPATLVAPVVPFIAAPPKLNYKQAVARSKEQHFITSVLWPPMVIEPLPVTYGPMVRLARARKPPKTQSSLKRPVVTAASIVFRAIVVKHAAVKPRADYTQRHFARWRLRPPTALFLFIAAPIKLVMVAVQVASKRRTYRSIIRPPAVVAAVALALPIHLSLVAVKTAVDLIRRRPRSKLKPPTSVDPSIVFPPVDARLAPSGRQARASRAHLSAPTVIGGAKIFAPIKAKLALQVPRQGRQTHSKLRLPIFKPPDIVAGAVAIVDSILTLVGLGDTTGPDVGVTETTGAGAAGSSTGGPDVSAADGSGPDVEIDDLLP